MLTDGSISAISCVEADSLDSPIFIKREFGSSCTLPSVKASLLANSQGEPSVDDLKPNRRPFQFSLRKLMLWTTVWSVYLSIVCSLKLWPPAAVAIAIHLAALSVIRVRWGFGSGVRIAVAFWSGLAFTCFEGMLVLSPEGPPSEVVGVVLVFFCFGYLFGLLCFPLVHFLVRTVDWLDTLLQTKTPQDQ